MDTRVASWLFLGGVLLVMLGSYGAGSVGAETLARSSLLPWGREVELQITGLVFAIIGCFALLRESDPGEEF